MKSTSLIIFDFDGTLADTGAAIKQSFWNTLNELKISLSNSVPFDVISCLTLEGMFRAVGVRNESCLLEARRIYQKHYASISSRKAELYPGVPETLDLLKQWGIDLAIATNERRRNLDRILSLTGISSFFSKTICENEVTNSKPDPEMARTLMEDLNALPGQTMIVGDSILDIGMGQAAGGSTCGVAYGANQEGKLAAAGADWIIRKFEELPHLLRIPRTDRNIETRNIAWVGGVA